MMREGEIIWEGEITGMSTNDLVRLISDGHDDTWLDQSLNQHPEVFKNRPAALQVTDIRGRYLRGITLTVAVGEVVGVAGLLGSGREELPYIVAGAEEAISGSFTVGDRTVESLTISEARDLGIAFVPADRAKEGIIGSFTTRENVSLASLPSIASSVVLAPPAERTFAKRWLASVHADPTRS